MDVLTRTRDIETCHKLDPVKEVVADLTGLISRVNPKGHIAFFRLRDTTGSVQLVADQSRLPTDVWEHTKRLHPKDRVRVRGPVDSLGRVLIDQIEILSEPTLKAWEIQPQLHSVVTTHFLLARLRSLASRYLREECSFEEFEPSCFTLSVPQLGIEPIEVVFRGFGGPAYLIPSPAPELLAAVLATGYPKVFSVSRCFSATIRDGYTSAESLVLSARQLDASIADMYGVAQSLVKKVFASYSTMPGSLLQEWLSISPWPIVEATQRLAPASVLSPQIQVLSGSAMESDSADTEIESAFQIYWPPRIVIAEGHVELLDKSIRVGGLTIHLERMVTLLKQEVTLRRLRDWGPK